MHFSALRINCSVGHFVHAGTLGHHTIQKSDNRSKVPELLRNQCCVLSHVTNLPSMPKRQASVKKISYRLPLCRSLRRSQLQAIPLNRRNDANKRKPVLYHKFQTALWLTYDRL